MDKLFEHNSAYFEILFESAPEGIVILDNGFRVIRCNHVFTEIFGYTKQEAKGRLINELIVSQHQLSNWKIVMQSLLSGERVMHEALRQRKDGSVVYVSILATQIVIDGLVVGSFGIYRDISNLKRAEAQLMQRQKKVDLQNEELKMLYNEMRLAKDVLLESNQLKVSYLSQLSHELRNPLNGIFGSCQVLANTPQPLYNNDIHDCISSIFESCFHLEEKINNMVRISFVETFEEKNIPEVVHLNAFLSQIVSKYKRISELKGLDLILSLGLDDNDSQFCIDSKMLNIILVFLLGNAMQYTYSGSIHLGYHFTEGKLLFFVKDTGIGMAAEHMKEIQEHLSREENSVINNIHGLGMGLALSKLMVKRMGGQINLESTKDVGTTVLFSIPLLVCKVPADADPHESDFASNA